MRLVIIFILIIFNFSCTSEKKINVDYVVLDIESTINNKKKNSLKFNNIVKKTKLIPVETTDSTLFKYLFIADIIKDKIISFDKEAIYSINKESGNVKKIINNNGAGPREYKFIIDVVVEDDSIIFVYDTGKRGFLKYDFKGNFIQFIKNDSISTFEIMKNGNYCVCFSPFINSDYHTAIYDKNWNLISENIVNQRRNIETDMFYWNSIQKYNDELMFKDFFSDTIHQIKGKDYSPFIVLSKGKYKLPLEIGKNIMEKGREANNYIQQESYASVSNYCFLSYILNNSKYYDVWNIEESALIFRNIVNSNEDIKGIPIVINDVQIGIWSDYAKDNMLYSVINPEDALKIMPKLPEDTNPIILEIEL